MPALSEIPIFSYMDFCHSIILQPLPAGVYSQHILQNDLTDTLVRPYSSSVRIFSGSPSNSLHTLHPRSSLWHSLLLYPLAPLLLFKQAIYILYQGSCSCPPPPHWLLSHVLTSPVINNKAPKPCLYELFCGLHIKNSFSSP